MWEFAPLQTILILELASAMALFSELGERRKYMTLLTRDSILNADDLPTEDVYVPEWKGTVRVRTLTARERDEFEANSITGRGKSRDLNMRNLRARLVALAVVDDAGQPLFTGQDAKALGEKSAAALDRLFDVARKLSGLTSDELEELAGNSDAGKTGDLNSDLP